MPDFSWTGLHPVKAGARSFFLTKSAFQNSFDNVSKPPRGSWDLKNKKFEQYNQTAFFNLYAGYKIK